MRPKTLRNSAARSRKEPGFLNHHMEGSCLQLGELSSVGYWPEPTQGHLPVATWACWVVAGISIDSICHLNLKEGTGVPSNSIQRPSGVPTVQIA
ncbi:hypothetical protein H8958_017013, partial [Nasalis larvatus]